MSPEDRAVSPEELRQQIADAVYHVWQNPPESPCFFPEPFADAVLALPAIRRALAITAEVDATSEKPGLFGETVAHNRLLRRLRAVGGEQ